MVNYLDPVCFCAYLKQQINQIHSSFGRGEFVTLKHNNFQQKHACLNLAQRSRSSVFVLVFISFLLSLSKCIYAQIRQSNILIMYLLLFLCLWCWCFEQYVEIRILLCQISCVPYFN